MRRTEINGAVQEDSELELESGVFETPKLYPSREALAAGRSLCSGFRPKSVKLTRRTVSSARSSRDDTTCPKEVKLKSTKLVGTFILLLGLMVGVAPALGRIAKRAVLQRGGGLSESPQTAPVIRTDKEGYLAGEVTAISGEGFSPFERVMLRVAHIDGTVEAGVGLDAWV